jgi:hypothetical protein
MLMTAPAPLEAPGIACDASCKCGAGFTESTRAGRMTDTAIVTAAKAAPMNPNARRGVRAWYGLGAVAPPPGGANLRVLFNIFNGLIIPGSSDVECTVIQYYNTDSAVKYFLIPAFLG